MPRAAQAVLATPTADEEIVVGVDVGTDPPSFASVQLRRAADEMQFYQQRIMNTWAVPTPDCQIAVEQDAWSGTRVEMGAADFTDRPIVSRVAATRQGLGDREHKEALERTALRELKDQIDRSVVELTQQMRSFQRAAQMAASHMRAFNQVLADFVFAARRTSGWLGDSGRDIEFYEISASLDRRSWGEVARRWNYEARRQTYLDRNATQWLTLDTTSYTNYQWNWIGTADTTGSLSFQNGWLNNTSSSGSAITMLSSSSSDSYYLPCDCERQGTCTHCVARARKKELAQRRALKKRRQREIAAKRGRKLLLSMMTSEQMHEYAKTKTFRVVAADGRTFRLRKGRTAELLNEHGQAAASYCIHLYGEQVDGEYVSYVDEDTTIAQILMLQTDPAEFERIANITKLHPSPPSAPSPAEIAARRRRAIHFLAEHDRDTEELLRAEGVQNPREWVAQLREQARTTYRRGDQWQPVEPSGQRQEIALAIIEDEMHLIDMQAEAREGIRNQNLSMNQARDQVGLPPVPAQETARVIQNMLEDIEDLSEAAA